MQVLCAHIKAYSAVLVCEDLSRSGKGAPRQGLVHDASMFILYRELIRRALLP